MADASQSRFQLILIKRSHYDDDGYLIRWWRAMSPSNSLASVYGMAADCADRQVLGSDSAIDIVVMDETNTRIDVSALIERFRRHRNFGCVALVGFNRTSIPARLTLRGHFEPPEFPSPLEDSTSRDVYPCSTDMRSSWTLAGTWASPCSPEKPRADLKSC